MYEIVLIIQNVKFLSIHTQRALLVARPIPRTVLPEHSSADANNSLLCRAHERLSKSKELEEGGFEGEEHFTDEELENDDADP